MNYLIPIGKSQKIQIKIKEVGSLVSRKNSVTPYALVEWNGLEKQLIFPKNAVLVQNQEIEIQLSKGLLSFYTVENMQVISKLDNSNLSLEERMLRDEQELTKAIEKQKQKIVDAAEKTLKKGNKKHAIELYKRAMNLFPEDKEIEKRLLELEDETMNKLK